MSQGIPLQLFAACGDCAETISFPLIGGRGGFGGLEVRVPLYPLHEAGLEIPKRRILGNLKRWGNRSQELGPKRWGSLFLMCHP